MEAFPLSVSLGAWMRMCVCMYHFACVLVSVSLTFLLKFFHLRHPAPNGSGAERGQSGDRRQAPTTGDNRTGEQHTAQVNTTQHNSTTQLGRATNTHRCDRRAPLLTTERVPHALSTVLRSPSSTPSFRVMNGGRQEHRSTSRGCWHR